MAKRSPQFVIGGILLTVDTYAATDFTRTSDYRWPAQERISHPSALQFVGEGVEKLSLSGTAHMLYGGRMFELDSLRAKAAEGKPVIVVTGTGKNLGRFCITSIKDGYNDLMDDSRAKVNKWSIDLEKYGED
jgi:phage protein U